MGNAQVAMAKYYRERAAEDAERSTVGDFIRDSALTYREVERYGLTELKDALLRLEEALEFSHFAKDPTARSRLLKRKSAILSRIQYLTSKETIKSLRELVEGLPEEDGRAQLIAELDSLESKSSSLESETQATASEQQAAERDAALLKQELMERKWAVWSGFLARESVATLVGSLLLVVLAGTLIVAMFVRIEASAIISNSFLIVLGYFFGQGVDKKNRDR